MRFYLVMPVVSIVVIVIQTALLDLLFWGKLSVDLALIVVVYAAFRLDIVKGAFFALLLGFLHDSIGGFIAGVYMVSYLIVFFLSKSVSPHVHLSRLGFIVGYLSLCMLFQGCFIFFIYRVIAGIELPAALFIHVFIPQSIIVGMIAPFFFAVLDRYGGIIDD